MNRFRALQIDHVELIVPDRHEAAAWYGRVLGLEIVPAYESWAADPQGPLMITCEDGSTKLALFEGRPADANGAGGFRVVAFRVGADGFVEFVRQLPDLRLTDARGRPVTSASVVDHALAYSIYFCDPYGHRLELTTYDYDATRHALEAFRSERDG